MNTVTEQPYCWQGPITVCNLLQQVKHQLDRLFGDLLGDILRQKPHDPLQFIIDSVVLGPQHAAQVSQYYSQLPSVMPDVDLNLRRCMVDD